MIVFYFLLGVLFLSHLRCQRTGFYTDYLSIDTTNAVKGIFIALVFIKHVTPYVIDSGYLFEDNFWNRAFLSVNASVGQWIVAMFLFYSGYGIMESIKKKGITYLEAIPRKRILTTLINFDIAVSLFAIIALFLHKDYSIGRYLLSFTGWEDIGNSNWYIFVILLCYLIVYWCFRVNFERLDSFSGRAILCFSLLALSVLILSTIKPSWWYDTMLCFGFGIFYSIWRERIEPILQRYYWFIVPILFFLLICIGTIPYSVKGLVTNAYCIIFCFLIIMLTMKFRVNNLILIWSGRNLFPLYIYQRIPMIILSSVCGGAFVSSYPVLYTFACLLITLLFGYFYRYWAVRL